MKGNYLFGFIGAIIASFVLVFLSSCGNDVETIIKLDNPTNIQYDVDSKRISWDMVKNADAYVVTIDDSPESTIRTNSVQFSPEKDEFVFSVKAKSDGVNTDSDVVSITFACLSANLELQVAEDGTVTWNEVSGASGYKVSIDGKETIDVATPIYSDLTAGTSHSVKVKPIKASTASVYYYSSWSKSVNVNKLSDVEVNSVKYSDGKITWKKVSNVDKYKVTINDEEFITEKASIDFVPGNTDFTVTIQPLGNHTSTYDGTSIEKKFVYLSVVENVTIENGKLTWSEVDKATGYQIKLNSNSNTPIEVGTNSYAKISSGVQYSVSILPIANDENTSYFSNWNTPTPIYVLPAPAIKWTGDLDVADDQERTVINWEVISQAEGYTSRILGANKQGISAASLTRRLNSEGFKVSESTILIHFNLYKKSPRVFY